MKLVYISGHTVSDVEEKGKGTIWDAYKKQVASNLLPLCRYLCFKGAMSRKMTSKMPKK